MHTQPAQATTPNPRISTSGWDERALLLLGVLMDQSQHGYQINDFIEQRLACIYPMKKPTAYALLDRLESSGAISVHVEQVGNRPPRKVYTLTRDGRALFHELLEQNLRTFSEPVEGGDIGLIFLPWLDSRIAIDALRERLVQVESALANIPSPLPPAGHHERLRLDLALDHARHMREAERSWLLATIAGLENGSS